MAEPAAATPTLTPAAQEILAKSQLVDVLYKDPKMRPKLLALVKEFAPDTRIPELDTATAVEERVKPMLAEVGTLRDDLAKERAERAREREHARAVAAGVPEAELADVEKMMTDKKIGDWDTAVTHYSLTKRAAEPRSAPTPLQMPDMKGLWKNPKLWARNEAYKVIGEMRGGR